MHVAQVVVCPTLLDVPQQGQARDQRELIGGHAGLPGIGERLQHERLIGNGLRLGARDAVHADGDQVHLGLGTIVVRGRDPGPVLVVIRTVRFEQPVPHLVTDAVRGGTERERDEAGARAVRVGQLTTVGPRPDRVDEVVDEALPMRGLAIGVGADVADVGKAGAGLDHRHVREEQCLQRTVAHLVDRRLGHPPVGRDAGATGRPGHGDQ